MSNRKQKPEERRETPLNPANVPFEEKQRQLEGRRPRDEQSAVLAQSDTDSLGEFTRTDYYEGELEAGVGDDLPGDPEQPELLTEREERAGETSDAFKAAEEGLTYIPPVDPPGVPGDSYENAQIASGTGISALGEPYNRDHHSHQLPSVDDVRDQVYEALRADSSTSRYAEQVVVLVRGDTVILRGVVDDLSDSDNLAAVASYVDGVAEVLDELEVPPISNT